MMIIKKYDYDDDHTDIYADAKEKIIYYENNVKIFRHRRDMIRCSN